MSAATAALATTSTTTTVEAVAEAKASVTSTTTSTSFAEDAESVTPRKATDKKGLRIKSTSVDTEEVVAQGDGSNQAEALANACTEAVTQVCGVAVIKNVQAVRPGATLFSGILLSYRVLENVKNTDGTYTVKIQAVIKPPAGDMFSDRIALVLPSSQKIKSTCASGNLKTENAKLLADALESTLKECILADSRFVILDRSSSLAQKERDFASSSHTSRTEHQKSGNMKAADFVIEVVLKKGEGSLSKREYKIAKRSKYEYSIDVELELQFIDVVTGGIVAKEDVAISDKGTGWREETCVKSVLSKFTDACGPAFKEGIDSLFSQLEQ